ncbi:MAG: hypothetical protein GXY52_11145 [Chloroflexi bacterium]|nr:hypothetical protein [Chloroflexota bacterium]
MMRKVKTLIPVAILLLVVVILAVSEPSTHLFHRLVDNLLYNNYHHYLSCSDLPDIDKVEKTVAEHSEIVEKIKNVNPDHVEFMVDSWTCPGKGSITIYYASTDQRSQIDQILPDKTFFGIPVTLINR